LTPSKCLAKFGAHPADAGALWPSGANADLNETDGRVAIGCSLTIWTVVEVRRKSGLDGRKLLGGIGYSRPPDGNIARPQFRAPAGISGRPMSVLKS
jgi:hypothetical protein